MKRWTISDCLRKISAVLTAFALALSFPAEAEASARCCDVYNHGECSTVPDRPRIALTFDDGPHGTFTPQILDILAQNNVKATFFVVGENAAAHPEILERTLAEGHEIGNHTYAHEYLKGKPRGTQCREIDLCDYEIFDHSEYCSHLLRPPGGLYDENVKDLCAEKGYSIIIWSVDTRDWTGASAADIEKCVLDGLEDGAIVLMHDFNRPDSHTVEALRDLIPEIRRLGYDFVTVSELIGK